MEDSDDERSKKWTIMILKTMTKMKKSNHFHKNNHRKMSKGTVMKIIEDEDPIEKEYIVMGLTGRRSRFVALL